MIKPTAQDLNRGVVLVKRDERTGKASYEVAYLAAFNAHTAYIQPEGAAATVPATFNSLFWIVGGAVNAQADSARHQPQSHLLGTGQAGAGGNIAFLYLRRALRSLRGWFCEPFGPAAAPMPVGAPPAGRPHRRRSRARQG